jgi:hypothetical protein
LLTEAAEIEHNLLCSYLYATFSLKREGEGHLTPDQAAACERWRKVVLSIALEEADMDARVRMSIERHSA